MGPDSDTKWVIGAITSVADTANKTPKLSSVFHAFITCCNFLSKCIYGMKSMGAILIYVWKMPIEYWDVFSSQSWPLVLPQYC